MTGDYARRRNQPSWMPAAAWPTFAAMKASLLPRRSAVAGVLLIALIASFAAVFHGRAPAASKLLIVHSYGLDLPWVGDVDLGFNSVLQHSGSQVQVRRHHMNLLNHPDCTHLREAA